MIPPNRTIELLRGPGLTLGWLREQSGCPAEECLKLLSSLGAVRSSGKWILPSPERLQQADRRMSQAHRGKMIDGDLPWSERSR